MTDEAIAALREDPDLGPLVEEYGPVTIEPAEDFYQRFVEQSSTTEARGS